jgi:hypothetical protein
MPEALSTIDPRAEERCGEWGSTNLDSSRRKDRKRIKFTIIGQNKKDVECGRQRGSNKRNRKTLEQ